MRMLVYATPQEKDAIVNVMGMFYNKVFTSDNFNSETLKAFNNSFNSCFVLTEKHSTGFRVPDDTAIMMTQAFRKNESMVAQAEGRAHRKELIQAHERIYKSNSRVNVEETS